MATINPTTLSEYVRSASYQWANLSTGDTAVAVELINMQGLAGAVQVTGTFGGATIVLEVSNDGANYATLKDGTGTAISFTAAGMVEFSTAARYIRVSSSGGTGDDVTVTVVLRG